jgi:hypothetical protein
VKATPYAGVNEILDALVSGVQDTPGLCVVGMYLYGSLSSGDFDPRSSDIDFMVVTDGDVPRDQIAALEAMHHRLWASGMKWAAKLEGTYIPRQTLRRYDPDGGPYPTVNEGRFYVAGHGSDWIIQRHIVREHGVVLVGPPPHTLIDPVSPDDLRHAAASTLSEWWIPVMQENPGWLKPRLYQAFTVLTMCRVWYTLLHGAVASKPAAAQWALDTLDARWHGLIARALVWADEPHDDSPPDELAATLDFIRFTAAHTQEGLTSC